MFYIYGKNDNGKQLVAERSSRHQARKELHRLEIREVELHAELVRAALKAGKIPPQAMHYYISDKAPEEVSSAA